MLPISLFHFHSIYGFGMCSMVVNFRYTKVPCQPLYTCPIYTEIWLCFSFNSVQCPMPLHLQHEFDIRITSSPTKWITIPFSSNCITCLYSVWFGFILLASILQRSFNICLLYIHNKTGFPVTLHPSPQFPIRIPI